MGRLARIWRHSCIGLIAAQRAFPLHTLQAIEGAIRRMEAEHLGQLRFVVEASLDPSEVWSDLSPRERAIELFGTMRIWDTEHNDGVLLYVLLADRDVEIVADRGVARLVPASDWEAPCRAMEEHFRAGRFHDGALAGIAAVAAILARYPAPVPRGMGELPDLPILIA